MSDQQPPSPNEPRKPGSEPPGSFNWRVLILFAIAIGLLTLAYVGIGDGKGRSISYSRFEQLMAQGKVIQNMSEFPLEVVTRESSFNAEIVGHASEKPVMVPDGDPRPFRTRVNLDLHGERLNELVGVNAHYIGGDQTPAGPGEETASFAEFESWVLRNEVILEGDKRLKIAPASTKNREAVLIGYRQPKSSIGPEAIRNLKSKYKFRVPVNTLTMAGELNALFKNDVPYREDSNYMRTILISFLPILVLIVLLFLLFRHQMKAAGRGAMSFGKSKARLLSMDRDKVTFRDVAGIQEAKEELWEIVDFLKDPRKFQKLGGNIPKGVLMVGPPGTGKTLLARAIAGEANVPFFSISGSDFVEMFVGVGASRVRDLFKQAKDKSPSIIFIDEIDAIGRARGKNNFTGSNDER